MSPNDLIVRFIQIAETWDFDINKDAGVERSEVLSEIVDVSKLVKQGKVQLVKIFIEFFDPD